MWDYLFHHPGEDVAAWTRTTLWLGALPVLVGLLIALPLGWLAHRYRWVYPPLVSAAGLLYTIPSLVLFLVLPGVLGTGILDPLNVAVALTLYTIALLVRVVADGLDAVDVRGSDVPVYFPTIGMSDDEVSEMLSVIRSEI
jgi:osmoprotectant transport system permease protein